MTAANREGGARGAGRIPAEPEPPSTDRTPRELTPPTMPLPGAQRGRSGAPRAKPGLLALGDGRFELLHCLGKGGMGVVYAARDRERSETVALKTIRDLGGRTVYRLKKEFRSLVGVSHPNLVGFKEFFAQGDEVFFTMDLIEGEPLSRKLKRMRAGEIPRESALDWLRQVAEGLTAIHAAGKVHRDLKPSNVMVQDDGHVVILDFGLSCEIEGSQDTRSFGGPVGTPTHASPEQVVGDTVTPAADWYALGVILFEVLSGRLPFRGSLYELVSAKIEHPAPELEAVVAEPVRQLVRGLLARHPEGRPSHHEVLAVLHGHAAEGADGDGGHAETAFVGRHGPLAQLDARFARASEGAFASAVVSGPSGMGKTTLASELLQRKRETDDALVFASKCYEHESIRYNALDGVFDDLRRYLKSLPEQELAALAPADHEAFAAVFPTLGDIWNPLELAYEWPIDPTARRRAAFRALRELLGAIARRRRLVLWLDDLQWGDADSAHLLRALTALPEPPPLFLLGCARSDESGQSACLELLEELGDSHPEPPLRIALEPLTDADASVMLEGMLGAEQAGRIPQIVSEAHGSPYFLAELARHGTGAGPGPQATLASVFEARLAALPDAARRVLEVCAVAELPISPQVALVAAGVEQGGHDYLRDLGRAKLTRGYGVGASRGIWCYHDRVREAVAAGLSDEALCTIHGSLAAQLEAQPQREAERLVEHFRGAGLLERAATYAAEAGDEARRALAFARSAQWYEQSLSLGLASDLERRTLKRKLAEVLEYAGRAYTATDLYLELAKTESDPQQALELRRLAAGAALAAGLVEEGQRALNDVLGEVGLRVPTSGAGIVAGLLYQRGRLRVRGLEFTERKEADVDKSELLRIDAVSVAAAGYMRQDVLCGALFASLELRLALDAGEIARIGRALCNELLHVANEGEKQKTRLGVLLHLAQWLEPRIADRRIRGFLRASRATTTFLRGRPAEAVPTLAQALEQLEPLGTSWELTFTRAMWAVASQWRGEMTASVPILTEWVEDAKERRDLRALRMFTVFRAFGQVAEGRAAQARRDVAEMLEATREAGDDQSTYIACHGMALGYCYEGGRAEDFEALLRQYETLSSSSHRYSLITRLMCTAYAANCHLALAVMGDDRARRLRTVERMAKQMHGEQVGMGHAHADLAQASVHYLRGRPELAVPLLERAGAGFEECEQPLMAAACRYQAGRAMATDSGAALSARAVARARELHIPEPERMFTGYAPAFAP